MQISRNGVACEGEGGDSNWRWSFGRSHEISINIVKAPSLFMNAKKNYFFYIYPKFYPFFFFQILSASSVRAQRYGKLRSTLLSSFSKIRERRRTMSLLVINEVSSLDRDRTAVGANWAFDLWDLVFGRSFLVEWDYIAGHWVSAAKALPQSLWIDSCAVYMRIECMILLLGRILSFSFWRKVILHAWKQLFPEKRHFPLMIFLFLA